MISRNNAEIALQKCNYERYSITPSINSMHQGIFMTVYFANELHKHYAYGENGTIHGYLAPAAYIHDRKAIQRMIGYRGSFILLDSEGRYVHD